MSDYPSDLKYTQDHEWARVDGDLVRVGITAYAVEQLGDVTLVDLPEVGAQLKAQQRFGDIESVKTVSELFAPIDGEVVEVNAVLQDQPEIINESPYQEGWMIALRVADVQALSALHDVTAYRDYLSTLDE